MRIQYASDLHLEIFDRYEKIDFSSLLKKNADILILAGDIGFITSITFINFIDYVCSNWKYIFFVFGNHEFQNITNTTYTIKYLKSLYKKLFSVHKNFILLDNDFFILDDYIFIGSTLWSYVPKHHKLSLSDYSRIYTTNDDLFTPTDQYNLFISNYKFLKKSINYFTSLNKKIIIITHHAPSKINTCAEHHPKHMYGYATDMSSVFSPNIKCWFFGHTHFSCVLNINNMLLVSNQFGYLDKEEYTNYEYDKVVNINE